MAPVRPAIFLFHRLFPWSGAFNPRGFGPAFVQHPGAVSLDQHAGQAGIELLTYLKMLEPEELQNLHQGLVSLSRVIQSGKRPNKPFCDGLHLE